MDENSRRHLGRQKPVIAVVGPTASGKSHLLSSLYDRGVLAHAQVIAVDSMQCYRYMPIGTAAPSGQVTQTIPHHLIGTHMPNQQYSVATFVTEAEKLVARIHAQGKVPVLSGGSGYYLLRLLCGLPSTPSASPEVRSALRRRMHQQGKEALYQELCTKDPDYARRISRNDSYRILRALEIITQGGVPVSSYPVSHTVRSDWRLLLIGLKRERPELHTAIAQRVHAMFKAGLTHEVTRLLERGYTPEDPAMGGIGYRQFFCHGTLRDINSTAELHAIAQEIIRDTKRYAKRQMVFFKQIKDIVWIHPHNQELIAQQIRDFLTHL